jgi:hypothetical protein
MISKRKYVIEVTNQIIGTYFDELSTSSAYFVQSSIGYFFAKGNQLFLLCSRAG